MVRSLVLLLIVLCCCPLRAGGLESRLRLLIPGDAPAAAQERALVERGLENVFRQLRFLDRADRRSRRKQLNLIEERLRDQVLRQYDPAAAPGDAFRQGTYNDATAALLYALTLEAFGIPYEGRVDHWEAYLIADPAGRRPRLLRHPAARPHQPTAELRYRREYLGLLRQVTDENLTDLSEAAADDAFYRYYYRPGRALTFLQLSAYAQLRAAQSDYANGRYAEVFAHLTEAKQRENRRAFGLLEEAAQLQLGSLTEPDAEGYVTSLFELWREDPTNAYLPAALLRHFDERQRQLLAAGELDAARNYLNAYAERGPAAAGRWREELQLLQNLRLLNYYQEQGQLVAALHLAETLHEQFPDNANYQDYLAELTLVQLRRDYPDPDTLVAKAQEAIARYPFLEGHDRYADILLRQYALRVRDAFAAGDAAAGERRVADFRRLLTELPNGNDRPLWTLTAFVAASNYYFAEQDYAPARKYIDEALRYDPDNDFLLHQQDLLSRY